MSSLLLSGIYLSNTLSRVTTCESGLITGGAFSLSGSNLGLTLNRSSENITIPSIPLPAGTDIYSTPVEITEESPYTVPSTGSYAIVAIGGRGGTGGKGGDRPNNFRYGGRGGSGGDGYITYSTVSLSEGDTITISPGAIGASGAEEEVGDTGGTTYVLKNGSTIVTASGGSGGNPGAAATSMSGGAGGQGGDGSRGGSGGLGGNEPSGRGPNGLGGDSIGPNNSSRTSTSDRYAVNWSVPFEIFGEQFYNLNDLMEYSGTGRAFIMGVAASIYPLP